MDNLGIKKEVKYDEWAQFNIDRTVLNSIKFYMMLSMILMSNDVPEMEATATWKSYVKDGEAWHNNNPHIINYYNFKAYQALPSEFLSMMEIPRDGHDIKIMDNNMRRW